MSSIPTSPPSGPSPSTTPPYFALGVLAGCVLALQIVFTRIFSIVIWHHFTYLVIGVALLGGGAAGTYLAVRRPRAADLEASLGPTAAWFGVAILASLLTVTSIEFDPLRLDHLWRTLAGLLAYFVVLFATFFAGGLVIAGCFSVWASDAHRLYFADLVGAGLAVVVVLWVLQWFGGPGALVAIALLGTVAALGFGGPRGGRWRRAAGALIVVDAVLLTWIAVADPIRLPVPESKDLGWALRAQGVVAPEFTAWNPVARVDVLPQIEVAEPMIVGGVSSTWREARPPGDDPYSVRLVTLDGTSMTGIYEFDGRLDRFAFLRHAVIAAVYELGLDRPSALTIGVGGGLDILLARVYGASRITAIELNADVARLLTDRYADESGRLAFDPTTEIVVAEGRSFLIRDSRSFDVIQGIGLDNIAALNGGAYVLAESYIYTVESFGHALDRLTDRGVFSWTRGAGAEPREMLRLAGLAAEALRRRGVSHPAAHLAIVGNETESLATLLMARAPFTEDAIARLRAWAAANRFPMLFDPFERRPTRYAEYLLADDPRAFEAAYRFNIHPVTDDSPFFYNYFRLTDWRLNRADEERLYRFPMGNLVLVTLVSLSVASAIAFILVPLWVYRRDGIATPSAVPMLAYFGMLGLGFIFVEIVLIQRFTLLIGYPTLAVTTSIFSMLVFSGVGSLLGRGVYWSTRRLRWLSLGIALGIVVYAVALPEAIARMLQFGDSARVAASIALAAPLALALGLPLPSGLKRVGARAPAFVPWAWGMNGVCSVVGASMVVVVGMLTSFTVAMLLAAGFYVVAAGVAASLERVAVGSAGSDASGE
jgi:hypothetical protein